MASKPMKKKSNKLLVSVAIFAGFAAPAMFFGPKVLSGSSAPIKVPVVSHDSNGNVAPTPHTSTTQAGLKQSDRNPFQ